MQKFTLEEEKNLWYCTSSLHREQAPIDKVYIVYKPGFQEAYFPVHIEQNIDNLFQFTIAL